MIIVFASLLTIGVLVFILSVRVQDLPEAAPVSPFDHLDERKAAIYENLRDLQFEYRVGKLSDQDYQQTKQDLQKEELMVKVAEYRPAEKKVVVRVENAGPSFGRVLDAEVSSGRDKATQGGFPIFPHSQRQVEIPWEAASDPAKVQLHLTHFKLEQGVTSATTP